MLTTDIGRIYVLRGQHDGTELAKLGMTRNGTPDARATDYGAAHAGNVTWHVHWQALTTDVAAVEARCHGALGGWRYAGIPGAREVYAIAPDAARTIAQPLITPPPFRIALTHIVRPYLPRILTGLAAIALTIATTRSPGTVSWLRRLPYRHVQLAARALQTLLRSK
jgi:hypothetical protein